MKSRHASGDDLGMPHCYASIPPLMLLSVIDLSLQRTPRSISSTSEWTLQHEQWARKPLNNAYWCSQGTKYSKKMTYGGGTRLQHVLFFVFFPSLCWIFYNLFLHVMEFFFFFVARGSSGLGVGGRDGEQASCLDAKLFWQASADFQLFNRSNWLTGSIHEETILPRGSFRFQHDGMDENCTIGTDKEWKRYILTSPGLKKICYY